MKKIVSLLALVVMMSSCEENLQSNNPSFQAKQNDVYWRANEARVSVDASGAMTITAYNQYETVTLETSSTNPGTYVLGTTNQNNFASYSNDVDGVSDYYDTGLYTGPAFKVSNMINRGTGYQTNTGGAQTTGGTGSGLRVATQTTNGTVTAITVVARGVGYTPGDLITIVGGNNNATFRVLNIQQSNGEIKIEEVENGLFTGTYKFNAVNENGDVITFSEGVFYKIPLSSF
ncbi:DUF6252 family protein [Flavobacterium channae]|uniref:DUF6252 family protein n=1 Tax=Flavobacterium channae TaxID=2897181 RepID=UPI001E33D37B|nr:DUF6252 family protein [Flavobacterium channae]UGS23402.1 DUF6252 family protein [Flavobacterium channae]